MGRLRFSIAGLMALVLAIALGFASLRFPSEPLAGTVVLLTVGALALGVLAAVYRRGEGRASWLGFALLGWGYMVLASGAWWDRGADRPELITSMIIDRLHPHFLPDGDPEGTSATLARLLAAPDPRDRLILTKLDQPVSMSFANATPLEDVLKYIKSATQGPKDPGIPIYVDPGGLREANATMASPISFDVEGVPLRRTLLLALGQLGLTYAVRDGLLTITKGVAAADARLSRS